jgi:hypothetical protein
MSNILTNLNNCVPVMRSEVFPALRALSVSLDKLDHLGLLNLKLVADFPFDIDFKLEPL